MTAEKIFDLLEKSIKENGCVLMKLEDGEKIKNFRMNTWDINADIVENEYGMFVDWEERFYTCPFCGEPVYECDWTDEELENFICPICEDIDL